MVSALLLRMRKTAIFLNSQSVCLSVIYLEPSCTLLSRLNFFEMFLTILYLMDPLTSMQNFTKIVPGKSCHRGLNATSVAKYSDSDVAHVEGYNLGNDARYGLGYS